MALIDKASLLMVPSVYEDGTLYNILPSGNKAPDETGNHNGYDQTRADFTFSRGSNLAATRVNADGLIEKGRENLLLQSNQFDTTWGNNSSSETSGQADKDGGTDAWLLNSTGSFGSITQSFTAISGVSTLSIYAKAGTNNWLLLRMNATSDARAWFDLENGVLGSTDGPTIESKIEAIGTDGWYRCSITGNTSSFSQVLIYPTNANLVVGAAGSIYIQSAQLEYGLAATDYIESGSVSGTAGVLENTPRIDYSSGAGALLLEPSRTNLVAQSEYFGSSDWSKLSSGTGSAPVVTDNYAISPEGVKNAARIVFDKGSGTTTSDFSLIQYSVSTDGVGSIYLKGESGGESVTFLVRGASYSVLELTTEWQRFDLYSAILNQLTIRVRGDQNSNDTATIYAYGAQCENASYPSSYVPTYGSAATRGADSCIGGGDTASINSTEGVLYAEVSALANDGTFRQMTISNGTNDNRFSIDWTSTDNQIRCYIETQDVSQGSMTASVSDATDYHKIAVKYKANDFALWVDGSEQATNTSAAVPLNINQVRFDNSTGSNSFVGNVKQLAVFDEALSDSELATLTTL